LKIEDGSSRRLQRTKKRNISITDLSILTKFGMVTCLSFSNKIFAISKIQHG